MPPGSGVQPMAAKRQCAKSDPSPQEGERVVGHERHHDAEKPGNHEGDAGRRGRGREVETETGRKVQEGPWGAAPNPGASDSEREAASWRRSWLGRKPDHSPAIDPGRAQQPGSSRSSPAVRAGQPAREEGHREQVHARQGLALHPRPAVTSRWVDGRREIRTGTPAGRCPRILSFLYPRMNIADKHSYRLTFCCWRHHFR